MEVRRFRSLGGVQLAYRDSGPGRPLILLHGFLGNADQWLDFGIAGALQDQGFRLLLLDFRAHGLSEAPLDPAAYPPDVLADDGLALIEHLGLGPGEYDLVGYSLGGRIVVRMLARGAAPGRAIAAGQGLAKISGPQGGGMFERVLTAVRDGSWLAPGSAEAQIAAYVATLAADPRALLAALESLIPTTDAELRAITTPTLVAIGDTDTRADADKLADRLAAGHLATVPGSHETAFSAPELATAITAFLTDEAVPYD